MLALDEQGFAGLILGLVQAGEEAGEQLFAADLGCEPLFGRAQRILRAHQLAQQLVLAPLECGVEMYVTDDMPRSGYQRAPRHRAALSGKGPSPR